MSKAYRAFVPWLTTPLLLAAAAWAFASPKSCPPPLQADTPTVPHSIEHADIVSGVIDWRELMAHGRLLFTTKFNRCDGAGRPLTTGGGDKRDLPLQSEEGEAIGLEQVAKLRTSAPDSDACAGCHNDPVPGAAGEFVANVFVLAQTLDPVTLSVSPTRGNSRNTLGMHGSGAIEMLAREMTAELQAQAATLPDGTFDLQTKGVTFTVTKQGGVVVHAEGIDHDLIVKPFHQAGKVVSLREFTVNAMNHHHGMQAEERFDLNPAKGFQTDYDGDGVHRELTIGDITAVTLWQAQLPAPTRIRPGGKAQRQLVRRGRQVFHEAGCASCHKPTLRLDAREFVEPNPFNPPGTCAGADDGCAEFVFDLARLDNGSGVRRGPKGGLLIHAYTDLKRHNLCDDPGPDAIRWFCNERLAQGRPDQNGKPGTEYFLTRKLWDVGNTAPYGHRGDLSTITEAILQHGGEARDSRNAFAAGPLRDQRALVAFLKTLQVPEHPRARGHAAIEGRPPGLRRQE